MQAQGSPVQASLRTGGAGSKAEARAGPGGFSPLSRDALGDTRDWTWVGTCTSREPNLWAQRGGRRKRPVSGGGKRCGRGAPSARTKVTLVRSGTPPSITGRDPPTPRPHLSKLCQKPHDVYLYVFSNGTCSLDESWNFPPATLHLFVPALALPCIRSQKRFT